MLLLRTVALFTVTSVSLVGDPCKTWNGLPRVAGVFVQYQNGSIRGWFDPTRIYILPLQGIGNWGILACFPKQGHNSFEVRPEGLDNYLVRTVVGSGYQPIYRFNAPGGTSSARAFGHHYIKCLLRHNENKSLIYYWYDIDIRNTLHFDEWLEDPTTSGSEIDLHAAEWLAIGFSSLALIVLVAAMIVVVWVL
jgi:hypothetical protein